MMVLAYIPLAVATAIVLSFVLAPYSPRLSALHSRIAYRFFGGSRIEPDPRRERLLRTAAIGTPYREYVAKTYLYVYGTAVSGIVFGVYVGIAVRDVFGRVRIPSLPSLGIFTNVPDLSWVSALGSVLAELAAFDGSVFLLFLASGAVLGAVGATAAYLVRWQVPTMVAETRRRQIDASMPRMVAFIYALTRGGMAFPDVLRALARNEGVFGEGAAEAGVAVRKIDLFNVDLVTAMHDLSSVTPSDQFESFTENLGSVLQSGRNVSEFLEEQYERYRDQAQEQQEEILTLLATVAETYVTVVVAGILFLVTILLIIGLTAGNTLFFIRVIAYFVLPAANLLFLTYLLKITQPLRASLDSDRVLGAEARGRTTPEAVELDGGYVRPSSRANHARLRAYERIRSVRTTLASPVQSLVRRPTLVFYVTVPIAVGFLALRLPDAFVDGSLQLEVLDDVVVQTAILLMGTFALVYEVGNRRLRRLETATPDVLERLASLNEAGISIVSAFDRLRAGDVGALDDEVDRIWRDIQWGATVEQALVRFESRVRTPSITRVVTLITNAMRASNEIGPVLRIAAEQARADRRLERQRRQEMFTYLVVIYISFVVFLVVIGALDYVLIPNLPDAGSLGGTAGTGSGIPGVGGFEGGDVDAYRLAFFHTALVQSAMSGLVGGVMGAGSLKAGAKHSTVMLTVTYGVLTLLG